VVPWAHPSPKSISIGSAVFAELTIVTDRPTNRQTDYATPSVTIGRIDVRSDAMRPNSDNQKAFREIIPQRNWKKKKSENYFHAVYEHQ